MDTQSQKRCLNCRMGVCLDTPARYGNSKPILGEFLQTIFEWRADGEPGCFRLYRIVYEMDEVVLTACDGSEFPAFQADRVYYFPTPKTYCVSQPLPTDAVGFAKALGGIIINQPTVQNDAPGPPLPASALVYNCHALSVGLGPGTTFVGYRPPSLTAVYPPGSSHNGGELVIPEEVEISEPLPNGGLFLAEDSAISTVVGSDPNLTKGGEVCDIPPDPPAGTVVILGCIEMTDGFPPIPKMDTFRTVHSAVSNGNGYNSKNGRKVRLIPCSFEQAFGDYPPAGLSPDGRRYCGYVCFKPVQ